MEWVERNEFLLVSVSYVDTLIIFRKTLNYMVDEEWKKLCNVNMWTRLALSWRASISTLPSTPFATMSEANVAGPTNTSKRLADLRGLMKKDPKVDA